MKTLEERDSPFDYSVSDKPRTMTAPWLIQYDGQPMPVHIPAGAKALFDKKRKILHVHDNATGISITATPHVFVRLDYTQDYHDIQFVDPNNPNHTLCGLYVSAGDLGFEDNKLFNFLNTEMFRSACRLLSSPVFNPWRGFPDLNDDVYYLSGDFETGELWLHPDQLKEFPDTPVDENRGSLLKFLFETTEPIEGWDRIDKVTLDIPPGPYEARVVDADKNTGAPILIEVCGLNDDTFKICLTQIKFEVLDAAREAGTLFPQEPEFRPEFDPRGHTDLAMKAVVPPKKKGIFGRLLAR